VALTIWSTARRFPVGLQAAILARAMLCVGRQVCLLAAAADGSWIRGERVSRDRGRGQWRIVVSASPRVLPRVMSGPDQAFDEARRMNSLLRELERLPRESACSASLCVPGAGNG
jgi:hypothetical protein